jgi:hypothetical protein
MVILHSNNFCPSKCELRFIKYDSSKNIKIFHSKNTVIHSFLKRERESTLNVILQAFQTVDYGLKMLRKDH